MVLRHQREAAAGDVMRGLAVGAFAGDLVSVPLITSTVARRNLRVAAYRGDERRQLTLHPTLASENVQFLLGAILPSIRVGLVPDYVAQQDGANGRVVTSLGDLRMSVFGTRMFLLRMPDRYQTLATRTLFDFVVAKAGAWVGQE